MSTPPFSTSATTEDRRAAIKEVDRLAEIRRNRLFGMIAACTIQEPATPPLAASPAPSS